MFIFILLNKDNNIDNECFTKIIELLKKNTAIKKLILSCKQCIIIS